MNFSPLFLAVGVSLVASIHTETPIPEPLVIESLELDDDLVLFEDDQNEWENEILVLEEELKEDAKSVELEKAPEAIALSPTEVPFVPVLQSVTNDTTSQISEPPLFSLTEAPSLSPSLEEPLSINTQSESSPLSNSEAPLPTQSPAPAALTEPLPIVIQSESDPLSEASVAPQIAAPSAPLPIQAEASSPIEVIEFSKKTPSSLQVDLDQAFSGSPVIYSILMAMSTFAVCLWLYSLFSLRQEATLSSMFLKNLRNKLNSNHFDDALSLCLHHENLFGKMIASGIHTRKHGLSVILESMSAEGKRASTHLWQRISLLNDIAIVAPMLGLLGTVLGMFYAFYDLNRSIESISTLFDGLGVSVGTTVAGLIVAILALILHSIAKYRLVQVLTHVEREAQSFVTLIDENKTEYRG